MPQPPDTDPQTPAPRPPPPTGRIDVHSHILPGIDDGCASIAESLDSVRLLKEHGYVGTICTPHCWPMHYPHITPKHIAVWCTALQDEIDRAELGYRLWTGGELRIYPDAVAWMQANGVPTLAGSRCVLCDFWEERWHGWIDDTFHWLLSEGFTPILAHPERSPTKVGFDEKLDEWAERGVLLQGNLRCFTGEEGFYPDQNVRRYMDEDRYTLLALDMHRPETLQGRLDGIALASEDYGETRVNRMLDEAVRELVFGKNETDRVM